MAEYEPRLVAQVREIARVVALEIYIEFRLRESQARAEKLRELEAVEAGFIPAPGAVSPETERIAECEHEPSSVRLGLCGRCGDPIVQIVKWVLRPGPRGDAAQ